MTEAMKLWNWTKRVISDQTGGVDPVRVGLERNPGAVVELGAEAPPDVPIYVLRVEIGSGFGGTRAGLPVYRHENPSPHPILKEIYQCEVAGKMLEAAHVYALRDKVQRHLEVIAPARSLPLCYFRLVPPAAVIRCLDDPSIWLPTVEGSSAEGPVIGLLSHPTELRVEERRRAGAAPDAPPSSPEITGLLRYIGGGVGGGGGVLNPWALYARGGREPGGPDPPHRRRRGRRRAAGARDHGVPGRRRRRPRFVGRPLPGRHRVPPTHRRHACGGGG